MLTETTSIPNAFTNAITYIKINTVDKIIPIIFFILIIFCLEIKGRTKSCPN